MTKADLLLILLLTFAAITTSPASETMTDVRVTVENAGKELHVKASMFVPARPRDVWAVLVDYDHATEYITDLQESRVIKRSGNVWQVAQKSLVRFGPISFPIESVREIQLFEPVRIEARQISGTLGNAVTHTELVASEQGTIVRYEARSANSIFVPNSFVQREAMRKFTELRAEILRRASVERKPVSDVR